MFKPYTGTAACESASPTYPGGDAFNIAGPFWGSPLESEPSILGGYAGEKALSIPECEKHFHCKAGMVYGEHRSLFNGKGGGC